MGDGGPVIIGSQRVDRSLPRQQGAAEKELGIRDAQRGKGPLHPWKMCLF